jgi:hypothetical protein
LPAGEAPATLGTARRMPLAAFIAAADGSAAAASRAALLLAI